MITRKTLLLTILSVCAFTAIYLIYVNFERKESIKKYFSQPQIGDIYKMKIHTKEGREVFYLKIKDIGEQSIYFYPGRMGSNAAYDVLLARFDTTETSVYSKKELAAIVAGEWNTVQKDHTQLIEIERKE